MSVSKFNRLAVLLALAGAGAALFAETPAEKKARREIERKAFERYADLAVVLPPEMQTKDLERYSTNRLDFAMNNGLAMTKGGRIWASWIAGGDGDKSFTVAVWSDDGGETWTDVKLVIDGHDLPVAPRVNIVGTFWLDPDGRLHCFTDQSLYYCDGRSGVWDSVCENADAPEPQWSKPRRLCHGHLINKPIVLKDGTWAASIYLNDGGTYFGVFADLASQRGCSLLASTDRGRTWQLRGTAPFPGWDWHESQFVEAQDGRTIRVYARVNDKGHPTNFGGCLMGSESTDGGYTWTKPHTFANLDNTPARFQIQRLKSGRVLLVKHGEPKPAVKKRSHLTAYLSEDDGATWRGGLLLCEGYGSYPDMFQAPDGRIYVSHDFGRADEGEIRLHSFTEEDVLAGKVVSPGSKLNRLVARVMGTSYNRKRFKR